MCLTTVFAIIQFLVAVSSAQSNCLSPSGNIRPTVAAGYSLQVVASGLSRPRGLAFDDQGHLLVVEANDGIISSHVVNEDNGCVSLSRLTTVVDQGLSLNHGIQVNGTTLYASNPESVYSWSYNASAGTASNQEELINGMNNSVHRTRTLLLSQWAPGMMVVSRGNEADLDPRAATIEGGTSQIRAFNLSNRTSVYDWQDGLVLGWGNRNAVGLAEHPDTGGIYDVENSVDSIDRMGQDVSNDNPGEELNFFGYLNGTAHQNQGGYYGYPWCLAVWNVSELPDNSNLSVGDQFAFDSYPSLLNRNETDSFCADETVGPRLTFQAHMAPLDIKFNNSGTEAWITFHGSSHRDDAIGYKLSVVQFANGEPVEPSNSTTAAVDIVANEDVSACPEDCMRPVAMAFDRQGRMFMSSDSSGEIYMVTRTPEENGATSSGSGSPTSSPSATETPASAGNSYGAPSFLLGVMCALALLVL